MESDTVRRLRVWLAGSDPTTTATERADIEALLAEHADQGGTVTEPAVGSIWRHVRNGGLYVVVAVASGQGHPIEHRRIVVYENVLLPGQTWARRVDEFMDGRFQQEREGDDGQA